MDEYNAQNDLIFYKVIKAKTRIMVSDKGRPFFQRMELEGVEVEELEVETVEVDRWKLRG